eukprot:SAG31_NODE_32978_length_349_cov_1.032000_1_plen_85_part_10
MYRLWGIGIQESATLVATDHVLISDLLVLPHVVAPYTTAYINASFAIDCDPIFCRSGVSVLVTWTVVRQDSEDSERLAASSAPSV